MDVKKKEKPLDEKFVNYLLQRGKKSVARRIFTDLLAELEKETQKEGLQVFKKALEHICPSIEVRPRRVGGAVYQIPIEVVGDRRISLGMRWLIKAANGKKGKPMYMKLKEEVMLALENQGSAVKKKEEVHRMAESNKAFAHLARYAF